MENLIKRIRQDTNNSHEYIIRKIYLKNYYFYLIYNETISSSETIATAILRNIVYYKNINQIDIVKYFYNYLPSANIVKVSNYHDILDKILYGYTIILIDENTILAIETKSNLDRSISEATSEKVIYGPKDSFVENYNKNIGLIRKRIRSKNLWINNIVLGKISKTSVGICYIKNIANRRLVYEITSRIKNINIDAIVDSSYIKNKLNLENDNFFPTIMSTERPDTVSQALLEGKIAVIVDNSPYVLILPTFLMDYFHTSDDYYQKSINVTFTRIIRVFAFFIAIFLPAYYIAITTHNQNSIPTNLLINLVEQRSVIPYPSLVEALIMIITFEILRESDIRMPTGSGTSISILGSLVLGGTAISAGLISPIMIIVTSISTISGLVFQSIEIITAIRWWRLLILFLGVTLGIYGLFIGLVLLIINITSIKNYRVPYLYPFAPIILKDQNDAILKYQHTNIKKRNSTLTKNIIRGK